jgi:hypothetical protein
MAPTIIRAVRFLGNVHSNLRSANGETILSRTIFSEQHFPKFLAVACVVSSVVGFQTMEYIRETHVSCQIALVYTLNHLSLLSSSFSLYFFSFPITLTES